MPSLVLAVVVLVSCSDAVLGRLTCDPSGSSPVEVVCRTVEGRDEKYCQSSNECVDKCFSREVESTSGVCTRSCEGSFSNSSSNVIITHKILPYGLDHFNLSVQLDTLSEEKYQLELKLPSTPTVCVCTSLPFSFIVEYRSIDLDKMLLKVKSNSVEIFARRIPIPRNCSDTERGVPYDDNTCGVPRLQPPTNVTMHCNETHTNISWNETIRYIRPDNSHNLIKFERFYLTVKFNDNTELNFVVFNASSVTLNTTAAMNITLYGYTRCSGFHDWKNSKNHPVGYSLPVHTSNIGPGTCCGNSTCDATSSVTVTSSPYSHPHPSIHSPLPPTSLSKAHSLSAVVAGSVVAVMVIILLITGAIIVFLLFIKRRKPPVFSAFPSHNSALVVYSPNTPEKEKLAIMQSFQILKSEMELFLQDTRSPQQSLSDWISEHHKSASTVFCVCNEEFERDWENKSGDSVAAMHTLKMLFQGDFSSKKYVVVLVNSADKVFIPACLKALPRINITDTPALAKFAE